MELSSMSMAELRKLERSIGAEIDRKKAALQKEVLKDAERTAKANGLQLSDLLPTRSAAPAKAPVKRKGPAKKKGELPPKYRNPNDASVTWSGHGRRPQWVLNWIASGRSLDGLAIS